MQTYPISDKEGVRASIFQVENAYIGPATIAKLLAQVEGVSDVGCRKMFAKSSDVHIEFQYLGRPYIVWEPFGDNSRYWIGPADMVAGAPDVSKLEHPGDIANLEEAFERYQPPLHRALLGNLLTLRMFKRFAGRS
jgi:hypothetical protein